MTPFSRTIGNQTHVVEPHPLTQCAAVVEEKVTAGDDELLSYLLHTRDL